MVNETDIPFMFCEFLRMNPCTAREPSTRHGKRSQKRKDFKIGKQTWRFWLDLSTGSTIRQSMVAFRRRTTRTEPPPASLRSERSWTTGSANPKTSLGWTGESEDPDLTFATKGRIAQIKIATNLVTL